MQATSAASSTVRTNIGVLPRSDAQRSHWLRWESVCAESITEDLPRQANGGVVLLLETGCSPSVN